jgi:hypothetical protein
MPSEITVVRGGLRLPCSSPRTCRDKFAKLLSHVDPEAEHGFGFEGKFYRPGTTLTDAEIRPGPEYPAIPIVLEFMTGAVHGIAGHRRAESIYILWRYDPLIDNWREIGRAVSFSWEWAVVLRPLAVQAMRDARGGNLELMPDFPAIAGRIASFLDSELKSVEAEHRLKLLGVLHDQFGTRLCL